MLFIDLFAGIGGFRCGLEEAGHKCAGYCEFDKFANASYRAMHTITDEQRQHLLSLPLKARQKKIQKGEYLNGEWYARDIRAIRASDMPRADIWAFGAPCQDFSIAGKRKGLDGDRSSLVRGVFRILAEMPKEDRPTWIIYENVRGMLTSNKGFDFISILTKMDKLGYDAEWQVINSRWFVPQNRERVYVIGHFRGRGSGKILPITGASGENSLHFAREVKKHTFGVDKSTNCPKVVDIANCITAKERGISNRRAEGTAIVDLKAYCSKTRRSRPKADHTGCLDTSCCQGVARGARIRRLTPKECFRLQGFSDYLFESAAEFNTDTQLYKQAGNSVTVDIVREIGLKIQKS